MNHVQLNHAYCEGEREYDKECPYDTYNHDQYDRHISGLKEVIRQAMVEHKAIDCLFDRDEIEVLRSELALSKKALEWLFHHPPHHYQEPMPPDIRDYFQRLFPEAPMWKHIMPGELGG